MFGNHHALELKIDEMLQSVTGIISCIVFIMYFHHKLCVLTIIIHVFIKLKSLMKYFARLLKDISGFICVGNWPRGVARD